MRSAGGIPTWFSTSEDGWIVVECPTLLGCVSQGKDEQEALANIKEAIGAWLWAEDQKAGRRAAKAGEPEILLKVCAVARLANISGKEAVRGFQKAGWNVAGQVRSHVVMTKPGIRVNLSVPQHKELSVALCGPSFDTLD